MTLKLRPYDAKEITLSIKEALRIVKQGITYQEWLLAAKQGDTE